MPSIYKRQAYFCYTASKADSGLLVSRDFGAGGTCNDVGCIHRDLINLYPIMQCRIVLQESLAKLVDSLWFDAGPMS